MRDRLALASLILLWYICLGFMAASFFGALGFLVVYGSTNQPVYGYAAAVLLGSIIVWALIGLLARRWGRP